MKKLIIVAVLFISIIVVYNYAYQDHRNIKDEQVSISVTAIQISQEFINNPVGSEKTYLNKTIEISGLVTAIDKNNLTLDNKVFCQLAENQLPKENSNIKIKGRFIGYDDLLEEIKLDQCYIIE